MPAPQSSCASPSLLLSRQCWILLGGAGRRRPYWSLHQPRYPGGHVADTTNRLGETLDVGSKILHHGATDKVLWAGLSDCWCPRGQLVTNVLRRRVTCPIGPHFVSFSAVQDVDCAYSSNFRDWSVLPRISQRVDDKARHGLQVKLKTRLDKVRSLEC